jgi:WD40 repeat protein
MLLPGNNILLVGLINGVILFRSSTMQLLFRLEMYHSGPVWSIANCGPGYVASGGDDGRLIIWDIEVPLADPH